ncbi:hypothetical protein EIY72_12995 [Pseudomonas vancouverensis]|uniref:Secreted protein n=1 Tax=Pseudomonas vancouverensis TaxID=95300 RepID=A0A4R4K7P8_PSEVA|nr:hypothetical protein F7R09_19125 [Pseudomonas vancouverensis]TDB63598.1 hypothetical protein EIY72_12995 [Pseudomonas vancouverensis]
MRCALCFVCISVAAVTAAYGFALTASPFCQTTQKEPKSLAPAFGPRRGSGSFAPGFIRGHRLRFASLHLLSMCAASPHGRCAPTPG